MSTQVTSVTNKLHKIRDSYLKQLPAQLETIRKTYVDLRQDPVGSEKLALLHRLIHTIRGASGTFGFSDLSAAAAVGEHLVKNLMQSKQVSTSWHDEIIDCIKAMNTEAANIAAAHGVELDTSELVAVAEASAVKDAKKVYLCDQDSFQRLTLAAQLECSGFEVTSFSDLGQFSNAVRNSPPAAIIISMVFPGRPMGGAEIMQELHSGRETTIPTIFISSHDEPSYRLAAKEAGSDTFLVKPVSLVTLCSKLGSLTTP
jgi:CheY-like chemotaxis protein